MTVYFEMVITDLDGTLFRQDHRIGENDLKTLISLGKKRVLRVVATGRSLFSARKVLPEDFPIDYLVFSSGAGIMDWERQRLLKSHSMRKEEVEAVFRILSFRGLDFMLHRPIPENHYFVYFQGPGGKSNPDFLKRCEIYRAFATPGDPTGFSAIPACQYVVIEPDRKPQSEYEEIKLELPGLKVIRTTSPLDGRSNWIEIFSREVSKSLAGSWLAFKHGLERRKILAVGNDYNDLDLLRWAGLSFVVGNSPSELKKLFPSVASNDESGFTEAVKVWIGP